MNDRPELHKLDIRDELENGAYDEEGNGAYCPNCGSDLRYNALDGNWFCPECEYEFTRAGYFDYIGAEHIPGAKCLSFCDQNYPRCKLTCAYYPISKDDPFL